MYQEHIGPRRDFATKSKEAEVPLKVPRMVFLRGGATFRASRVVRKRNGDVRATTPEGTVVVPRKNLEGVDPPLRRKPTSNR